jgi:hypothetical protein
MRLEFDDIVHLGGVTIAALAQRLVGGRDSHGFSFHGMKRPLAIFIRQDDMTTAFEINGCQIDLDEFELRFPGKRAEFERMATSDIAGVASRPLEL